MNEQEKNQKKVSETFRTQEPQPPFPYQVNEVRYYNKDANLELAGTLTIPNTQEAVPAVLLIAGYGPQDRNASGMGHKYFLVLADYLTRNGIAVLRVDKRGVGQSSGVYETSTSQDFASDVQAGVEYLKTRSEINKQQIGLVGHSEGGLIASMAAVACDDVAFIVLMAPAILQINDLVECASLQLRADGASESFIINDRKLRTAVYSIVKQESDIKAAEYKLRNEINSYLAALPVEQKKEAEMLPFAFTEEKRDALIKTFNSIWYRFFLSFDARAILKKIKIPVLAINGERDWIATPAMVFAELKNAFEASGNKDYRLIGLPNLNHCFQTCKTGALMEYAMIEETMAPIAMETIADFILSIVK